MKIAILYPADDADAPYSPEDVSGRDDMSHIAGVADALKRLGHDVLLVSMDLEAIDRLSRERPDLAFNLCDSGFMNRAQFEPHVSSVLEMLRIPYTGSDYLTLATSIDKVRVKKVLALSGIPTARFQTFFRPSDRVSKHLRFPLFVKPSQEHASIGIRADCLVRTEQELRKKVREITLSYHQPALVEEYVPGREIHTLLLGSGASVEILPLTEIDFKQLDESTPRIFTYEAKWETDTDIYKKTPYVTPAPLPEALAEEIRDVAKRTYQAMGICDYGRIDFRLDVDSHPLVVDVNPNPDISASYEFIQDMLKQARMTYDQFIDRIVKSATRRAKDGGMRSVPALTRTNHHATNGTDTSAGGP
jgi:D-alanine-D-alanine ligase